MRTIEEKNYLPDFHELEELEEFTMLFYNEETARRETTETERAEREAEKEIREEVKKYGIYNG